MKMKWPRGRYNGRRVIGLSFEIQFDVTAWYWKPIIIRYCGAFHWLCVRTFTKWVYE